jgi:uncharacterized protein YdaU (DUF1376 family)
MQRLSKEMSNKPHWMPLYWTEYLQDTRDLSPTEHGIYLLLLGNYWQTQKHLHLDTEKLVRMVGAIAIEDRNILLQILDRFFTKKSDGFHNKRTEIEIKKSKELSEKRSIAGSKGASKRLANGQAKHQANDKQLTTQIHDLPPVDQQPHDLPPVDQQKQKQKQCVPPEGATHARARKGTAHTLNLPLIIRLKATGEKIPEADWLLTQLIQEARCSGYRRINHLDGGLEGFMDFNPIAKKLGRTWVATPLQNRMAALAYAVAKSNVTRELSYALQAIDQNWEGYLKLIPTAQEYIAKGDYEIEV